MARDVISTCPVCEGELTISRLQCRSCGTALEGEFGVGRFGRLSKEQLSLLESFLRSRGNLKEMERELGISYPTVRGRVDALVRALGLGEGDEIDTEADLDAAASGQMRRRHPMPTWPPSDAPSWSASPDARSRRTRLQPRSASLAAGASAVATFYRTQTIEHPIGRSGRLSIKVTSSDGVLRGVSGETARIIANFQIRASSDEEADRMFAEAQLAVEQGDGYLRVSEPDWPFGAGRPGRPHHHGTRGGL